MRDGDALVFDGRLWHGSSNLSSARRVAILLQYTATESPVRMPDFSQLEWPFRFKSEPVPALVVNGTADSSRIDIVAAPESAELAPIPSVVGSIALPSPENVETGWQPYPLFFGRTPNLRRLSGHYSVLSAGRCPHPPHAHREEELLIMLDGEAELLITEAPGAELRVHPLRAGSFVYYPAYQHHTLRNATHAPITYLMFKWEHEPQEVESPLKTSVCHVGMPPPPSAAPFTTDFVLEGPTSYLGRLHVHRTTLHPGAGYDAHADKHDVALVLACGRINASGSVIEQCGGAFFPAGHLHDMRNIGDVSAQYLAFEFHRARA